MRLRVECTLFCNLQSWAPTYAILVIGLYELLDPTTYNSLSHPYWTKCVYWLSGSHHFQSFMVGTEISVTNDHGYVPFFESTFGSFPQSWLVTYHWVCNLSNTTGATGGARTAYLSGVPEVTPVIVARSLVFCVVFCRSLFVLFLLAIMFSVLRLTNSDYPFGIFKLFIGFL